MAASVRVEDDAFSDTRYDALAMLAGLCDADHARGKMMRLWRQCTLEGNHLVSEIDVKGVLGPTGVDALIGSRLGERIGDNGLCIRICGTEGRIEWLEHLRKSAAAGGSARAKTAARKGGKFTSAPAVDQPLTSQSAGETPATPTSRSPAVTSAPAPAPAPALNTEDKDIAAKPPPVVSNRPRDLLWDAIVEVTGADASIKSVASHIGRVKKALIEAKPPYTPAEVLSLPTVASVNLPWAAGRVLTIAEIEKNIGLVRSNGKPVAGKLFAGSNGRVDPALLTARQAAEAMQAHREAAEAANA